MVETRVPSAQVQDWYENRHRNALSPQGTKSTPLCKTIWSKRTILPFRRIYMVRITKIWFRMYELMPNLKKSTTSLGRLAKTETGESTYLQIS